MKTFKGIILFALFFSPLLWGGSKGFSQCQPMIIIDGNNIVADENATNGLKLPSWLRAAQTLNIGQFVYSVSVIEFSVNGAALDYSQNLSITTASTVPSNRVWKIEAVNKNATLPSFSGSYTYSTAGTYTFMAPPCISTARVQVWGAGGGGAHGDASACLGSWNGGGGGGGGFSEGFYQLAASGSYTVTVGAGGAGSSSAAAGITGGTSSVSTISISSTGGVGGTKGTPGTGGAAGTGSGQLNFAGQAGANGIWSTYGGKGGDAGNSGGIGGAASLAAGAAGTAPGGGGSGAGYTGGVCNNGGAGADGKVIITFGASASTSTTTTILPTSGSLQFSKVISQTLAYGGACYTVPSGKVFELKEAWNAGPNNYAHLYFGSTCNTNDFGFLPCYNRVSGTTGGTSIYDNPFPIWLKAGTNLYDYCPWWSYGLFISGIEWTVTP